VLVVELLLRGEVARIDAIASRDLAKAQDVTIKKLTRGNPTMAAKFEELKKGDTGVD